MKKPIVAVLAAVALSALVVTAVPNFAQAAPGQGHRGAGMKKMQKMADALGLTDAQKAQMKPILQSARQQGKAIHDNASLTPEAKKAQMKELRKSTMHQLKAILTPDQVAKMKAMRQQKKAEKA